MLPLRLRHHHHEKYGLNGFLCNTTTSGTVHEVNELINDGAKVNPKCSFTTLCNVVDFDRDVAMINALLRAGANINAAMETGKTALHVAACHDSSLHIAQRLIEQGAHVDAFDVAEGTPLRVAVCRNNVEMTRELLKADANVDGIIGIPRNDLGLTTLHLAAQRNNFSIAELLVAAGANLDALDAQGETPLCMAIWKRSAAMVKLLLCAGASLLVTAIEEGHVGILKQLIAAGAPVRPPDRRGENYTTPLHIAADAQRAPNVEMAKELIRAGAPLDALDEAGFTPLMRSLGSGHTTASIALIQAGARVEEGRYEDELRALRTLMDKASDAPISRRRKAATRGRR